MERLVLYLVILAGNAFVTLYFANSLADTILTAPDKTLIIRTVMWGWWTFVSILPLITFPICCCLRDIKKVIRTNKE